jgi:serine/threonine protein kinase
MEAERSEQRDPDERLYPVLLDFLESAERGGRPDKAALLGRYPEFASELEEFLDTWVRVENLTEPVRSMSQTLRATTTSPGLHRTAGGGSGGIPMPAAAERGDRPGERPPLLPSNHSFANSSRAAGEIGKLGPYRLLEVIGRGGMGVVFRAEDVPLRRTVAVKILRTELAADAGARARFLREARSAAALEHENVVAVYHVGEDGGIPFLGMQWLRGMSLEALLRGAGRLPVPIVLHLGHQIARGLAAAHGRGLLHRDVKPANLWVESPAPGVAASGSEPEAPAPGRIKILDFGLSRAVTEESALTHSGVTVGTPAYMAPEQAAGRPLDSRCDLYSLGVVLYRMCTGQLPFPTERPLPVRGLNPEVPPRLSDLITRLLSRDPAGRPGSAAEVADELATLAGLRRETPTDRARRIWFAGVRVSRRRALAVVALAAVLLLVYLLGRWTVRPAPNPRVAGSPVADAELDGVLSEDGATRLDDALLQEVAGRMAAGKDRLPPGTEKLYQRAQELYRAAAKSYAAGERERADELATAADDAARGLNHVLRGSLSRESDLPPPEFDRLPPPDGARRPGPRPPPPGPPPDGAERWRTAFHELERVGDRLKVAGNETEVGAEFVEAARAAYARARKAYADGEYRRAAEMAHGADIWTHVGEHVRRAGSKGADVRPDRPRPQRLPPDGGPHGRRPPPPPPDDGPTGRGPPPLPPED